MFLGSHVRAIGNSAYPDQMPQNAASDQGIHYLHSTNGVFSVKYK